MNRFNDLLIKVLSLGIGLAATIVLIAKICFELSYDNAFDGVERIYRIYTGSERQGQPADYPTISGGVALGFRSEVPGVIEATRVTSLLDNPHYFDEEGHLLNGSMVLADSCFFRIFDRPALAGDPGAVLAVRGGLAVSRSFAEKLGGAEEALGKLIWNEEHPDLKLAIGAVFEDFPANSSFDYDLLLSMETYSPSSTENWLGNDRYFGYVKLGEGVDPHALGDAIRRMQEAHQPLDELEQNGLRMWYYLRPFDRMHTSDPEVRTQIAILSVVAFLLLCISLLNYILIVLSSMVKRSREMGVRKCYGAGTADIYVLLLREAALHLLLALGLAVLLILAGHGIIGELLGIPFATLLIPQSLAAIGGVLAVVLLISIVVPAQLYLRVPVDAALKHYTDRSRRWKLALLGVQVFINIFLAAMLLVIAAQYRLVLDDNPGYDCDNLLYLRTNPDEQVRMRDVLLRHPEVVGVEAVAELPFDGAPGDNIRDEAGRELFNVADNYEATAGFFDLLAIPFVAGRAPQNPTECAVDEAFAAKAGEFFDWSDGAVGKTIDITGHAQRHFTISGVYRRILTGNRIWSDPRPAVRFYGDWQDDTNYMPWLLVKVKRLEPELLQRLAQRVAEELGGRPVELQSYAAALHAAYDTSRKVRNTLFAGELFALLIAFIGLLGFLRDETLRRSKETAIRKINGAGIGDILALFARDLARLSGAAAAAACAAAWWAAARWLEQFAVQVPLAAGYFAAATALVLGVVAAAVVAGCWRIATANPVESLQND